MPYSVAFNDEEKIVEVKVSGDVPGDSENARKEAVRLCVENRCNRLLVDLREKTIAENVTLECFSFGKAVVRDLAGVYIAHVLPTDPKAREDVEFTANVAANRGAVTREFDTVDEAKTWLRARPQ